MFKLRMFVAVLCVLGALICAISAKPRSRTPRQKAQDKCDAALNSCVDQCKGFTGVALREGCERRCVITWDRCYKQAAALSAGEQGLTPTEPTPVSRGLTRPPQGTLTQASPTPTPNTREKKKKN